MGALRGRRPKKMKTFLNAMRGIWQIQWCALGCLTSSTQKSRWHWSILTQLRVCGRIWENDMRWPTHPRFMADISNCKQGDMDVGEFYSKLTNLWNESNNLVKVLVCTCSGCKCGVVSKITTMYEQDKAHQFVMGLNNNSYSTNRSQIIALDPCRPLIGSST